MGQLFRMSYSSCKRPRKKRPLLRALAWIRDREFEPSTNYACICSGDMEVEMTKLCFQVH